VTFTWWLVPIAVLGIALILAPVVGAWWARDFRPVRCERCGRELIGSPPMHLLTDRMWCRQIAHPYAQEQW
jgi:hypothetical protein